MKGKYGLGLATALLTMIYSTALLADNADNNAQNASWTYTQSNASLKAMTPEMALQRLKDGNARFVSGNMKNRNLLNQVKLTKTGQYPFAVILSCMDSRGSAELIFDQGIGDIFSGRVAGNVANEDQLGGLEFATKAVGSHLIVVMGHTACGAVRGACSEVDLGNLTQLLSKIAPAVNTVKDNSKMTKLDCADDKVVDDIAKQNVLNMMQYIKDNSPTIRQLIDQKQVMIVGAMHDLSTGKVTFF